jgi:WD40 repeat protein
LAVGGRAPGLQIWHPDDGSLVTALKSDQEVMCMAISRDRRYLATGFDNAINIWDLTSGGPSRSWTTNSLDVHAIAWSPTGQQLALGDIDGSLRLFDRTAQAEVWQQRVHAAGVISVDWSRDGRIVVTGSEDTTIKISAADGYSSWTGDHMPSEM